MPLASSHGSSAMKRTPRARRESERREPERREPERREPERRVSAPELGRQEVLFDLSQRAEGADGAEAQVQEGGMILLNEVDHRSEVYTQDIIHMADVPVAADTHVRKILVVTIDKDGNRRQEERDGKILYRVGPHPTHVQVGERTLKREDLAEGRDHERAKPIMCNMIVTVIYERGVVQHDHVDIMHSLLSKMYDRYINTSIASGIVHTTKHDIAEFLAVDNSGRHAQTVEDALHTLQGLRVIKTYIPPEEGQPGHGVVPATTLSMGGIIVNYKIDKYAGGAAGRGGRRPDVITVDMNPALVRAMCGETKERPYLMRVLNYTKNAQHVIRWKRQLHRMIESRLESTGRFQMPLVEIWISCLGGSLRDLDPVKPGRWRKVRWKILEALRAWEATGYVEKVTPFHKQHAGDGIDRKDFTIRTDDSEITVPSASPDVVRNRLTEWVYCEPGPEFYAGRPQNKPAFARYLLAALVERDQVDRLLKAHGIDFIVDLAHKRMKHFITLLGDRTIRLSAQQWLREAYQVPARAHIVQLYLEEANRRDQAQSLGLPPGAEIQAKHYQRRHRLVQVRFKGVVSAADILRMHEEKIEPKDKAGIEVMTCLQMAIDQVIANNNLSRDILSLDHRLIKKDYEADYQAVMATALEVAIQAAGMRLWFEERATSADVPTFGENVSAATRQAIARLFPEPMSMVLQMTAPGRPQIEAHVGQVLRQRLIERYLEEVALDQLERRG